VCISWTIKCLISLMHGVTMKFTKILPVKTELFHAGRQADRQTWRSS